MAKNSQIIFLMPIFTTRGGGDPKVMGTVESGSSIRFFWHLGKSDRTYGSRDIKWRENSGVAGAAAGVVLLRAECIIYTLPWGLKWRGSQFGTASLTMKTVIFLEVQETMGPSLIVDSYSIITFIIVIHFYVEISDWMEAILLRKIFVPLYISLSDMLHLSTIK